MTRRAASIVAAGGGLKPSQMSALVAVIQRAYEIAAERDGVCRTDDAGRLRDLGVASSAPTAEMLDSIASVSYFWADVGEDDEVAFHEDVLKLKRWIEEDRA